DARGRRQDAPRFVYAGARRSLTGLNADEWLACKPGSEQAIADALLAALGGGASSVKAAADASGVPEAQIQQLANALAATKPSLVLCGVSSSNAQSVGRT